MKHIQIALSIVIALGTLMEPSASEAQQPGKVYRIGYLSISVAHPVPRTQGCCLRGLL